MIHTIRMLGMVATLMVAGVMVGPPAQATTGIPADGALNFTVLRDGDKVGTHRIRFNDRNGTLGVSVETDVNVKLPFVGISVYHFHHSGNELWHGGALVELKSTTDDDGTAHELTVRRDAGSLVVRSDVVAQGNEPVDIVPASLWNPTSVQRSVLLNTLDGHEMPITVAAGGLEDIAVRGRAVKARHYTISGDLKRELWYDAEGVLVKVRFQAKDDSRIEYVLQ